MAYRAETKPATATVAGATGKLQTDAAHPQFGQQRMDRIEGNAGKDHSRRPLPAAWQPRGARRCF